MSRFTLRRDAPPLWLTAMETRAVVERTTIPAVEPWLRRVRQGDGHPVLVLPGFTADDRSTGPLRSILRSQGYWVHGWRLGANLGPTPHIVDGLAARFAALHERHGGQPVSLIGWSLGGIFARELARLAPDQVRQVITLGSPFRITEGAKSAVSGLYDSLRPLHTERVPLPPESDRPPLEVPATAIYTRTDGIVRWWQCLESEGPRRESIAVLGSHSGLGFNPAAIYAVSDRLAQPVNDWQPFTPPRWARGCYPKAVSWRPELAPTPT
ncbi:MAG: esterase/lipase family protein [Iamia sp.]